MSRQVLDDGSNPVPNAFRWGLTQSITLSASLQQVYVSGKNRVILVQTDALGATVVSGSSGGTISVRNQIVAVQSVCTAGAVYAVNDTITLAGGTSSTAAVLSVTSISSSGGVTGATVSNAGNYGGVPANPVGQASSSGTGTSANFNISWGSNSRNIPANQMHQFALGPNEAIALVTLGTTTGGTVTISEAL